MVFRAWMRRRRSSWRIWYRVRLEGAGGKCEDGWWVCEGRRRERRTRAVRRSWRRTWSGRVAERTVIVLVVKVSASEVNAREVEGR